MQGSACNYSNPDRILQTTKFNFFYFLNTYFMTNITKKYSNGTVTIVWKPELCIHSRICWREPDGLPEVFNPRVKPWIDPKGADTARIIAQVNRCPSGALSYYSNDAPDTNSGPGTATSESIIEVMPDGPLMVYGNITVKDKEGNEIRKSKVTAFCRCGASGNKPFCDGSHVRIGFRD
jgi:uncharacterized Fe-S cluster protein YjdI